MEGGGNFVKDLFAKATPSQKAWLGGIAALGGMAMFGKYMRGRPVIIDGDQGSGGASGAGGYAPGVKMSSSGTLSIDEDTGLPEALREGVPADVGYQWMLLGKAFRARNELRPWTQFRPIAMTGGLDPDIPYAPPYYIEDDGSVSGYIHKYGENMMEGGRFWEGLKKVGKVIGKVVGSPVGAALLSALPGGGIISSAASVLTNAPSSDASSTAPVAATTAADASQHESAVEYLGRLQREDSQSTMPKRMTSVDTPRMQFTEDFSGKFSAKEAMIPYTSLRPIPGDSISLGVTEDDVAHFRDSDMGAYWASKYPGETREEFETRKLWNDTLDGKPIERSRVISLGYDPEGSALAIAKDVFRKVKNYLSPSQADYAILNSQFKPDTYGTQRAMDGTNSAPATTQSWGTMVYPGFVTAQLPPPQANPPIMSSSDMRPPRLAAGDVYPSPDFYKSACDYYLEGVPGMSELMVRLYEINSFPNYLEGGGGLSALWSVVRGGKLFSKWSSVSRGVGGRTGQSIGASLTNPGPIPSVMTKTSDGAKVAKGGMFSLFGGIGRFLSNNGWLTKALVKVGGIAVIGSWLSAYGKKSLRKKHQAAIETLLGPDDYKEYEQLLDKADDKTITPEEQFILNAYIAKISGHTNLNLDAPKTENSTMNAQNEGLPVGPDAFDASGVEVPEADAVSAGDDLVTKALPYIIAAGGVGAGAMVMRAIMRRKAGTDKMVIPVAFTGDLPNSPPRLIHVSQYDPWRNSALIDGELIPCEVLS